MIEKRALALFTFLAVTLAACGGGDKLVYPPSTKSDQVDVYFGTRVADPYRWLEDDHSADTGKWVEAQKTVTFGYLDKIPFREALRRRLTDVNKYTRYSTPMSAGNYYLYAANDGAQKQSVLYIQAGLNGTPEIFIDPNSLSSDGSVHVGILGFSLNRKYVAVYVGKTGGSWSEIRVIEIATKKQLPDRIQGVRFSNAAWLGDGFFYSGDNSGYQPGSGTGAQKIYYHKLFEDQRKDQLAYEDRQHPLRALSIGTTEDERYAFLAASEPGSGNELYWKDLRKKDARFLPLIRGFEGDNSPIENIGDKFLVQTNLDAPGFKVVLIDPGKPARGNWQTIVPEQGALLKWVTAAGGRLYCGYIKDAHSAVYKYTVDGKALGEVALPGIGAAERFSGWQDDNSVLYTFTSFAVPPTLYKYESTTGKTEEFLKAEVKFVPEDYETEQVFYESRDKTRIPMFIVHKKGLALNGKNPCYLTGYGGFNIGIQPFFSAANIPLIENGCILAEPNLRGGPEYGESWHQAGMLDKKQNVFDDFIAAAEYLIRSGYTSAGKLGIAGTANGGLLVGAALTQRPDLFKVALPSYAFLDMLRYQKYLGGADWTAEYGTSDNEKEFKTLFAYSPLHRIQEGTAYPATLVTAADHDDRIYPAHAFKFIATLQEKQAGSNPILIRIEGGPKDLAKAIAETADQYAFFLYNVGARVK